MDIKKAWPKLLLAVALLVAAVFAVIILLNTFSVTGIEGYSDAPDAVKAQYTSATFTNLGLIVICLGIAVVAILSALGKAEDKLPLIIICVAAIATILLVIGLITGAPAIESTKDALKAMKEVDGYKDDPTYKMTLQGYNANVLGGYIQLIIAGIAPLAYGLKKQFSK